MATATVVASSLLTGCGLFGSAETDERNASRDGRNEVVGGYFDDWAATTGQVAEVRSDGGLGDEVSDDDIALSVEAACYALATWPGDAADSLLNQGVVDPRFEWLVAPQVAALDGQQLVYFVQSAQAGVCPETAERIRLALCELSALEIEEGVDC